MKQNKTNELFDASFRIIGDNLDTELVSSLLEIKPDHAHRKGEFNSRKNKLGKIVLGPKYKTGIWSINSNLPETSTLEEHLVSLLDRLEPVSDKILQLSAEGYRIDIFCGYFFNHGFNGGFDISPLVLTRMGKMGIYLAVSVNEM